MSQHAEVVRQLNTTMSGSTEEFSSTADEMREAAASVVREIEFARGEVRRAVLELPAETRNSADAMRRVVTDQITALNALADVVKRQSSSLAMSGPGIYVPPEAGGDRREKLRAPRPLLHHSKRPVPRNPNAALLQVQRLRLLQKIQVQSGGFLATCCLPTQTPLSRAKNLHKNRKRMLHRRKARPAGPRRRLSPS